MRSLAASLCALAVCVSVPALAGHYDLADIDFVAAEQRERLTRVGVHTTEELLARGAAKKTRRVLALKTRIPLKTLTTWVQFCDLLRIEGVGPTMATLLTAAGAPDIRTLRRQDPAALLVRATEVNKRTRITELLPGEEQLSDWIAQAKALPLLLQ